MNGVVSVLSRVMTRRSGGVERVAQRVTAVGFLVGQVMREMKGRADAAGVAEIVHRLLDVTA